MNMSLNDEWLKLILEAINDVPSLTCRVSLLIKETLIEGSLVNHDQAPYLCQLENIEPMPLPDSVTDYIDRKDMKGALGAIRESLPGQEKKEDDEAVSRKLNSLCLMNIKVIYPANSAPMPRYITIGIEDVIVTSCDGFGLLPGINPSL